MDKNELPYNELIIRLAIEADLAEIEQMVENFVKGHPAENHQRKRSTLQNAYFKGTPIAHLLVAERRCQVLGMGQWKLIYDMFWGQFGASLEWLYVKPEFRGIGISAAIVAEICAQVRQSGGEFIHGEGLNEGVSKLYERVAMGWLARKCAISGEAFHVLADLSGLPPRQIVKGLPNPELNKIPPKERI